MEFLAITTLASCLVPPLIAGYNYWWESKKRTGGEAMATHCVMVMMLTVAQCLFLVQSIQNTAK